MHLVRAITLCAATTLLAGSAAAVELLLTFEGTGTGTIGATPFTGADFTVELTVESDDNYLYAPGIPITATVPATITISGIGTTSFTTGKRVFCNQGVSVLGLNNEVAADLINVDSPAFATYNLDGPIGPIFDAAPFFAQFQNIGTGLGNLSFSNMVDVTFEAQGAVEAIPVVSPTGIAVTVLLLAAAGAVLLRRVVA